MKANGESKQLSVQYNSAEKLNTKRIYFPSRFPRADRGDSICNRDGALRKIQLISFENLLLNATYIEFKSILADIPLC